MSEGIIQKSIKCLANAKLNETTYEVARDIALDYITNLQQKVEQLEKENDDLKNRLDNEVAENTLRLKEVEQLENIRKEAIEYILKNKLYRFKYDDEELFEITTDKKAKDDLLNILNKGSDKE